jgi:hypothetical protein
MNRIILPHSPCRAGQRSTSFQRSLVGLITAFALFVAGCAALYGPSGFGHYVLVVCKIAPDQVAVGQKRAKEYFSQVASGKKPRPSRRYIAVQTLDPNRKQQAKYVQAKEAARAKAESAGKSLGPEWTDPSQLHCIMCFDVVTHEAVGTNCYVVSTLPPLGETTTFDTWPAEFVANSTQLLP